jgi:hypothetical protein
MIAFYSTYIAPESCVRAKLAVLIVVQRNSPTAQDTPEENEATGIVPKPTIIIDIRGYKTNLPASAGADQLHELSKFKDLESKV